MNKRNLIKMIADNINMSQKEIDNVVNNIFEAMKNSFLANEPVNISGFGILKPKINKARKERNPQTGEEIQISETKTVQFKIASKLKELLNS